MENPFGWRDRVFSVSPREPLSTSKKWVRLSQTRGD